MDSVAILAILANLQFLQTTPPGRHPEWIPFAGSGLFSAPRGLQKSTCFSHRLGFALGRVHDGFGAQHGPNLGRFWSHVGAIMDHFWVLLWLLNLRPL